MSKIPAWLLEAILADAFYQRCARAAEGGCAGGRVTLDHAITVAGRQLQRRWAIVPVCPRHHAVGPYMDAGALDKGRNRHIALCRATDAELDEFPKAQLRRERELLERQYGPCQQQA